MDEKWQGFVKPNFGAPPAGYIPGYGRGATGFITRSDIGPAKMQQNPFLKQKQQEQAQYNDAKYDQWSGYSAPLFKANEMDEQDKEAEEAYDKVDKFMDGRRREQREKLVKEEMKKMEKDKPSIAENFSDLKRELNKVTYQDWLNLPESADSSIKKQKRDKYVPVPDTLISGLVNNSKLSNKEVVEGINDLGEAKGIILKSKLDKASDNVSGQTVVDKTGYLTSLNSFKINDQTYLGDLKKARLLLKSATTTNPKNPQTWVSAARVQQLDGKLQQARVIINTGLQHCPHSEDLWIEASRLEKPDVGKSLLARAVTVLPKSEKLWLTAARREENKALKRRILRKGLEHNSTSVRLWRELIQEEEQSEAKALLYKAVECLPKELELWLALAKLETYDNAKAVINKARKANPLEPEIWISAAKLQQTQSDSKQAIAVKIEAILSKAQQVLQKNGSIVKRQDWLQQAILCEKSNNPITCEILVNMSCGLGIEEGQLENVIDKDATSYMEDGFVNTARLMYKWGINRLNSKKLIEKAIALERAQNDKGNLDKILALAVQKCGDTEDFWLAVSDKFLTEGDFDSAFQILNRGIQAVQYKENLLIKKAKIFISLQKYQQAEAVLAEARQMYGLKSWVESIEFYWRTGNYKEAWKLCEIIYKKEKDQKVFELAFKIQKKIGKYEDCRSILQKGVEKFEKSIRLWLLFVQFEVENGFTPKARTILEKARVKNPKNAELHEAGVRLEIAARNPKGAIFCLAKGLSECPKNGNLWALAVELQPRANRKKKVSDAMEACPDNPSVNLCVAKIFWKQKKLEKAKKWFEKTVQMDPSDGDAWCYFYKFVLENDESFIQPVFEKIKALDLKKGRLWSQVLNSDDGWSLSKEYIIKRVIQKIDEEMKVIQ